MRLIDADRLINILNDNQATYDNELKGTYYDGVGNGLEAAITCVEYAPTIEERKHGHWVDSYECSVCGAWMATDCIGDCLPEEAQHYCYNCGAAMDEVK